MSSKLNSRINIKLTDAKLLAQQQRELPLKLLLLANLSPSTQETPNKIPISAIDFDQLFTVLNPTLGFTVKNHIDPTKDALPVKLEFKSLLDFEPDAILSQTQPLRRLVALRHLFRYLQNHLQQYPELLPEISSRLQKNITLEQ